MEQGIYGFPPGKRITVDIQEFETTGIWYKPQNAKLCFIEGCGGGGGGTGGSTSVGSVGGCAGVSLQIFIMANRLAPQENVVIGAGGAGGTAGGGPGGEGGNTTFAGITWAGGRATNSARMGYYGAAGATSWGAGGSAGTSGRHNNFGAGGGGGGGAANADGGAGGKPRTFDFNGALQVPTPGGGAAGGTISSVAGVDADPLNDRHGFGEGAGGGYGGVGGNGGKGRKGSGGGGGGGEATASNVGGAGGDGIIRIMTYSWE